MDGSSGIKNCQIVTEGGKAQRDERMDEPPGPGPGGWLSLDGINIAAFCGHPGHWATGNDLDGTFPSTGHEMSDK